jgi:hypothetical protein
LLQKIYEIPENMYSRGPRYLCCGIAGMQARRSQGPTPRKDTFDRSFTIKRSWLSDLLLSLPQSLYGKPNTFLHAADGVG